MVAIQTHDGLYDDANKKYLMGWGVEQKPRTSLPFILHQADLMAARIEFEVEWLPKLRGDVKDSVAKPKENFTLTSNKKPNPQSIALKSVASQGLRNMLDSL